MGSSLQDHSDWKIEQRHGGVVVVTWKTINRRHTNCSQRCKQDHRPASGMHEVMALINRLRVGAHACSMVIIPRHCANRFRDRDGILSGGGKFRASSQC